MRTSLAFVLAVPLAASWVVPDVVHADPQAAPPAGDAGYPGVVPGQGNPPPRAESVAHESLSITWPGFQMSANGGSRVFVQTSLAANPETRAESGRFVLVYRRARIPLRTNRFALDTRFFPTPVMRAKAEQRGRDVVVTIELRADVTPNVRSEAGQNGFFYTFVEFPPGNYAAEPATVSQPGGAPRES